GAPPHRVRTEEPRLPPHRHAGVMQGARVGDRRESVAAAVAIGDILDAEGHRQTVSAVSTKVHLLIGTTHDRRLDFIAPSPGTGPTLALRVQLECAHESDTRTPVDELFRPPVGLLPAGVDATCGD